MLGHGGHDSGAEIMECLEKKTLRLKFVVAFQESVKANPINYTKSTFDLRINFILIRKIESQKCNSLKV